MFVARCMKHSSCHSLSIDPCAGNTTFGGEIVKALSQPDVTVSSRAAAVVTCMIDDNPAVKQRLQSIPLELSPAPGAPPTLLMPQCISHLSNAIYAPGQPLEGFVPGNSLLLTQRQAACTRRKLLDGNRFTGYLFRNQLEKLQIKIYCQSLPWAAVSFGLNILTPSQAKTIVTRRPCC